MNLEQEIFKRSNINYDKLLNYGFIKNKDEYIYTTNFLDNNFKAIITINSNKKITGKVIDLLMEEEYTNFRVENQTGEFVNKVKEEYTKILIDIKNNCFETTYFISRQANYLTTYIKNKYNDEPEFLWKKFPGFGIFRNKTNEKWYAIFMNLDKSKITKGSGEVEILNLKLNEEEIENLLKKPGYYKAYHMKSTSWITIILDDTIKDEELTTLLDKSYNNISTPDEWIIPANPKYFDIMNCFNDNKEIIWKQSSKIKPKDIIYMYVAEPYSKIVYKCEVIETDIPYEYKDDNVSMNKVMKIKHLKTYNHDKYTFKYLNELGIKAIRGPRKITKYISNKLK